MRTLSVALLAMLVAAPSLAVEDWRERTADLPLIQIEVPAPGELWIRVDPARSARARDVMAEVARRYHELEEPEGDVVVVLWVGGRPLARESYPRPAVPPGDPPAKAGPAAAPSLTPTGDRP